MTPMDVPLISPVLPEIQAVFGISESRAGLLITVYALPGIVLAPVIGALADRVGRRYVLSGCLALFGLAGTAIAFTNEFDSGDRGYVREALRAIPTVRALTLYGIMFVSFTLLFGGFYTALPFYLAGEFGYAPATVGLVNSAVLLVAAVVSTQNGRLAAHVSKTTLLVIGFALYAGGFLGVALTHSPPAMVGALLVFGAGSGLVTPTLFAGLSALAPDSLRAGVMSLQTTTIGISQVVGPVLFTLAGGAIGYQSTLLGASVAATLFTAALAVAPLES